MSRNPLHHRSDLLWIGTRIVVVFVLICMTLLVTPGRVVRAAGITVNSTADTVTANDGQCTLREAIANANSDSDTTNGDCASGSGPDTLSFDPSVTGTILLTAELLITSDITINGPGAANLAISGNDSVRVISTTNTLILDGLTIRDGLASGDGGGIHNTGSLTLNHCVVDANEIFFSSALFGHGGGIYNTGTLTLDDTSVTNNVAAYSGGGIYNDGGTVSIVASTISDNNAANDDGGGILHFGGTLTMNNSSVTGNQADDDGGGVRGNWINFIEIQNSTIADNTAGDNGGGLRTTAVGSTFKLVNSTVSNNHALGTMGGGFYTISATVTITNVTFWGNDAVTGGGGIANGNLNGVVNLASTIVAGNTSTAGGPDLTGSFVSQDYNLIQDTTGATLSGSTVNNITGQAPLLGALANNGGGTTTHSLLPSSPALNQIPVGMNGCGTDIATDQRGVSRPQGSSCDIGAFESEGVVLEISKSADDATPDPGQRITFTVVVSDTGDSNASNGAISDTLPSGLTFAGPATLEGSMGTVAQDATDLPNLASGLSIEAGKRVTVTFPVTVNMGLAAGTLITNEAGVTSDLWPSPATDSVVLTVADAAPVAVDDSYTVLEDSSATSLNVMVNDTDPNGATLSITAAGTPDHGGTATPSGGMIDYAPATDFNGTETFTYTVSDGSLTGVATVEVTVTPVNDAPSFTPGSNQFVTENAGPQSVTNWATNISPGAANESGQTLTFAVTNDNNALFSVQPAINAANGTLTFTPAPDTLGTANVTVVLEDNGGVANGGDDTSALVSFTIRVLQQGAAAVDITKTAAGPGGSVTDLQLGDTVTYTISLVNPIGVMAEGVVMTDVLPAGVTFGQWLIQGSAQLAGGDAIQWGPNDILGNSGFTISFTVVLTTSPSFAGQSIVNTAEFTSDNADAGSDEAVVTLAGGYRILLPIVFGPVP
jgi:uncharacterized repeat protein (TIGR01451 family)/CSLREA domain-containing protein